MHMHELPFPPVPGCSVMPVSGLRAGSFFETTDWVIDEVPVALAYNGVSHAVMLATPSDLEDFAIGFSRTEGIVDDLSQIYDVELIKEERGFTLALQIASSSFACLKEKRRSLAGRTGCGLCGTDSLAQAVRFPTATCGNARFDATSVARALGQMRERQLLLGVTGSSHAAAWCTAAGEIVLMREDVGRHNALDKLVGALLRSQLSAGEGFVVVTSRASYEMVQKAATLGVTVLAAVSGVTGLAIEVAQSTGVALLGFARGQDVSIYSHPQRINLKQSS